MAHTQDDFPVPVPFGEYEMRIQEMHRHWQREDLIEQAHSITEEEGLVPLRAQWRRISAREEIETGKIVVLQTHRYWHPTFFKER